MATATTVAAITAATAAVAGTSYSVYSGERQKHEQKKQARAQKAAIDEQNAIALEERKQRIEQMRKQLSGTGRGTRGENLSGIRAVVGGDKLG